MNKKFTKPNKSEGWDELVEIKSETELELYKKKISLVNLNDPEQNTESNQSIQSDKIIKFPRTKHIMNLGAMTRDDLLMDKTDIETMLKGEITVEEKIDGANLGFRLIDGKIRTQNRSHYVCSESHSQFKKLDQWIESNKFDLIKILSQGNLIIYGEWLYSKHSINYTKLSDYFIMFDLYDVDTQTFYSRDYLEKLLLDTEIKLVPLIYRGKATLDKLKALVQTKSVFYDGIIEGIYIRSFDENKLRYRAKIVRADFIAGDEHWTKGKQVLNTVIKF
jgi:atypical dual specificity phosphatase